MRIVVVGGGVMGLATAWQLARRGEQPIVVERFARGHHEGASHGETRNFNNAYAEEHYLDLLARAREGWDALGVVEGEPLLRRHGLVSHGSGAALGSAHAVGLEEIARRLDARGIPAEVISGADAARRWPGMRFEDTVLHSPDAGVARAAAALRELERRVVAAGGEVRLGGADGADWIAVQLVAGQSYDFAMIAAGGDPVAAGRRRPRRDNGISPWEGRERLRIRFAPWLVTRLVTASETSPRAAPRSGPPRRRSRRTDRSPARRPLP